jgi:acetyl esterase/lipase
VLFWPVTNANFEDSSYDEFADGHFLTRNMMKWFWDSYTTDLHQRNEIYGSPLLATTEHRGESGRTWIVRPSLAASPNAPSRD